MALDPRSAVDSSQPEMQLTPKAPKAAPQQKLPPSNLEKQRFFENYAAQRKGTVNILSLIHISEPTRH
eukprot:7815358-Karenia_brevis.AAC.1